ncbi:uncharacterized protein LOC128511937 [Clarias gariepinus]|uniref:uncharacterized protein LOC128511937 n=1 Tax=Clarias gariepinus TaxID=13013 RepID=UPI00234C430D|nr:uncharacterized protein LOC128511937 [Clarias gariepinus]
MVARHRDLVLDHMLGLMAAASSIIPLGLLHMRLLQWWLKTKGFSSRRNPFRVIRVSSHCIGALRVWKKPGFLSQGPVLGAMCHHVTLTTDASRTGWGAINRSRSEQDLWKKHQHNWHMTALEMMAVCASPGRTASPAADQEGSIVPSSRINSPSKTQAVKSMVRAHSTRGMAASKALAAGSTPQKVCDAAGWSTPHTFVKFYAVNLDLTPFSQPSSAVEVFIPELFKKCVEDETKDEYRFLCPRAGQFMCKVTKLMFEMEGEGEVLYRIVSWDSCPLDGLGQKEPAGPLYSINCQKGSIRKLHLPHCETRKDDGKLTVAHVTGGNVEIIQPLQVTDTHVIIAVHNLSRFGLLMIFGDYPIKAQVLVFDMNLKGKHRKNKLHMHLLPGNVPAEEVKKQECNMSMSASCQPNIASRATCDLTPGKEYRPVSKNTHHEITIQPEFKKFERDYGPNYHPTFEEELV